MPKHTSELKHLGFLGYWRWDRETGLIEADQELRRLFGIETGEPACAVERFELMVHPDDVRWLRRERPRSIGPSGHGVLEYRVIDRAGQLRWVMCRGVYDLDAEGEIQSGFGMLFDITPLRADGNSVRAAPAPLVIPLDTATESMLRIYEAAKQIRDPNLILHTERALEQIGHLLAREICRPERTTTH